MEQRGGVSRSEEGQADYFMLHNRRCMWDSECYTTAPLTTAINMFNLCTEAKGNVAATVPALAALPSPWSSGGGRSRLSAVAEIPRYHPRYRLIIRYKAYRFDYESAYLLDDSLQSTQRWRNTAHTRPSGPLSHPRGRCTMRSGG
ncbi:unnamed protein product [Arctia plantaginis]|uniref:Uncharacterized protein n=1 Tax=Arctia plantaginis TaxID=874455 RepID=A0A8S0Z6S3_ARCPL|nr:unnamed protein product [Arctia plantaginis]